MSLRTASLGALEKAVRKMVGATLDRLQQDAIVFCRSALEKWREVHDSASGVGERLRRRRCAHRVAVIGGREYQIKPKLNAGPVWTSRPLLHDLPLQELSGYQALDDQPFQGRNGL